MLHIVKTQKTIAAIQKSFAEAAANHKFGLLGTHNLREKMNEKGVAFERDCLVFEVCNPSQAKKVLDGNMDISTLLPCRVSVYEKNGKRVLATIKPTVLLDFFNNPELKQVAEEVEKTLFLIMDEAAR